LNAKSKARVLFAALLSTCCLSAPACAFNSVYPNILFFLYSLSMFGRDGDEAELRSAAPLKVKLSRDDHSVVKPHPMGLKGGWARFKEKAAAVSSAPEEAQAGAPCGMLEGAGGAGKPVEAPSQSKEPKAFGSRFEAVPLTARWTLVYSTAALR
jgi:hypothetical protein